MSLRLFFDENGYEVLEQLSYAEDVAAALQKHQPDVLVLDIMLKGERSGIDVAEEIRSQKNSTPILFISALTDAETINRIESLSHSSYASKPYDYEKLIEKLEGLVK